MESLDREIAEAFKERPPRRGPGRILVVGGTDDIRSMLLAKLTAHRHRCVCVGRLDEARAAVARGRFDLVLLDLSLPDGDALELARALQQTSPSTKTIALSDTGSFAQAVQALRCGVVDLVNAGIAPDDLAERINLALVASRADKQRDDHLAQLKVICKKLVAARDEVSEHLDGLCQDLAGAYQDMSLQMSEVAMATEFRTLLRQELDMEELLRTALEYLLAKTGPTNAAVFLPDAQGCFDLGAYVKYDCPRETITVLLNHLCQSVCPHMTEETEIVSFDDADEFAAWIGAEAGFLAGCQVVAFSCMLEGKCLAVMVLFRRKDEPFEESLVPTIDILRTIFAEQIANVVKVHHRAAPQWPKDPLDDEYDCNDYDEFGFGGLVA
ncbi:MAG: GAF domain-containing protein [Planctomycetota bacterium]|jgi:DNA-binding response OmpR family regulator